MYYYAEMGLTATEEWTYFGQWQKELFPSPKYPDPLYVPPNLLCNGYRGWGRGGGVFLCRARS